MRRVFLGFACNNHCVFCSQGALGARGGDAAAPEVPAGEDVAFVGGEPTLSPLLTAAAARAKAAGARWVLVQTNARRLCYPDYARSLADAGVDALDASLQGSTAAMHDYHTQAPGSWAQTLAGLSRWRALGRAFGITTVVTRSNFRHLVEIARLAKRLGADALSFSLAEPYGRAAAAWERVLPARELALEELVPAGREALRLGLGLCVLGEASSPDARRFFAGLGDRNEAPPAPAAAAAPGPRERARPRPGLAERRAERKVTGEALRRIFPELFAPEEARGG